MSLHNYWRKLKVVDKPDKSAQRVGDKSDSLNESREERENPFKRFDEKYYSDAQMDKWNQKEMRMKSGLRGSIVDTGSLDHVAISQVEDKITEYSNLYTEEFYGREGEILMGINNSHKRKKEWLDANINDSEILKALNDGVIDPDKHPSNHKFRDRQKKLELSGADFFNRTYQNSKTNAAMTQNMHQSLFLQAEPWNEMTKQETFSRERRRDKEFIPEIRFGLMTQNERIFQEIKNAKPLDYSEKDMEMIRNPKWKVSEKKKWLTSIGFRNNIGRLPMGKSAWDITPMSNPFGPNEPYIGGFVQCAAKLQTKGNIPELEMDPYHEFVQFSRPDVWESAGHISQSVRTGMNDRVMKMTPVTDNFSKNKHLTFYKQTLVKSKNVDHVVPFKHSNNYKGLAMLELRPMNNKMYPKTTSKQ
jgi:hypothetical protein